MNKPEWTLSDYCQIGAMGLLLLVALIFVLGHIAERGRRENLQDWRWPE